MEGFSSNLNDTFTSTRGCAEPMFFPQHILPLLTLYNAQWWGYESLTAIALVSKGSNCVYVNIRYPPVNKVSTYRYVYHCLHLIDFCRCASVNVVPEGSEIQKVSAIVLGCH